MLAGALAVGFGDGGKEQVEIARDIRHGADGGARVHPDGFLLDRDDRRKAEDKIDIGLADLRDEAFGVARQRLEVAALSFSVDGIEREARFPGAREPGDNDKTVAGEL